MIEQPAITVIETVLPILVTKIASVVSAGVRWSIIHCQTGGSIEASPLPSAAPSARPEHDGRQHGQQGPAGDQQFGGPGAERRQRTAATAPSTSRTSAASA